ncbi:hypothetical protein FRC11_005951 [Ceratobasidium sp. 423]|nr:hypothetical protein FRC11_005951 [Ceratobasidium sp. 423]
MISTGLSPDLYAQVVSALDPEEIQLIVAFLHVLRVVARYSTEARTVILESGQYHTVAVMLDLVQSHVALELKGKLFDTLAAFCDGPELGGEVAQLIESWKAMDAALEFVQASLEGFDLSALCIDKLGTESVQKLVQHPRFSVLRVLVDSGIKDMLLGIVTLAEVNQDSFYVSSLVQTLHILARMLEIQDLFTEVLLSPARVLSLGMGIPAVVSAADQILLWQPQSIVHITGLVNYRWSREVVLLSVQLIMKLSMPSCFNSMETSSVFPHRVSQLLGILGDVAVNGARIVDGYIKGLKLELGEELGEEDDQIRDAIINFLLVNMTTLPHLQILNTSCSDLMSHF